MIKLKKMDLNRNMTNEQLVEAAGKELDSGELLIVDKIETNSDDYINIYVAQNIDDLPLQSTVKVSKFEAQALGWDTTAILMRARFNAKKEFADTLNIGETIKGTKIRVLDSLDQGWTDQNPRASKEGEVRTKNGNAIYRFTQVLTTEEFDEVGGHSTITFDLTPVAKEKVPIKGVKENTIIS